MQSWLFAVFNTRAAIELKIIPTKFLNMYDDDDIFRNSVFAAEKTVYLSFRRKIQSIVDSYDTPNFYVGFVLLLFLQIDVKTIFTEL